MTKLEKIDRAALEGKVKEAYGLLSSCGVCPRSCRTDRKSKKGYCRAGMLPDVASFHAHFGEEPPISGRNGSGTIFFSNCVLRCVFCQNYSLSQMGEGKELSVGDLAGAMLSLQSMGCHNINFVTPTHYTPQIMAALVIARDGGLNVPLVYNCSGYESVEVLRLLDGIIDIYMPDFKYGDNAAARKYSNAPDYVETARAAHKEMYRQVGDLVIENGIAKSGLLIRHLVMPDGLASSRKVFDFIAKELSPDTCVNIMAQYYPVHKAHEYPEINRFPEMKEYTDALRAAKDAGLNCGWRQTAGTLARERVPEWRDDLADSRQ